LRALGVEPIDYRDSGLADRVRELAPGGVDAVFDHLGPASFRQSFDLLAPGGTLVAYGSAARLDDNNSMLAMFVGMLARLYSWTVVEHQVHPGYPAPYTVVLVELDDAPGVRLIGYLTGRPELRADQPMRVNFERIDDETTLPQWEPVAEEGT
jgi:NADPH:quinone reductase-like Zn-dependent oxidoreductase